MVVIAPEIECPFINVVMLNFFFLTMTYNKHDLPEHQLQVLQRLVSNIN